MPPAAPQREMPNVIAQIPSVFRQIAARIDSSHRIANCAFLVCFAMNISIYVKSLPYQVRTGFGGHSLTGARAKQSVVHSHRGACEFDLLGHGRRQFVTSVRAAEY